MSAPKKVKKLVNIRRLLMPEDNACLFHCVNQACFNNTATVEQLKRLCSRTVLSNQFYAPFLESNKETYARAVLHPDFWGGHVEQVIFSRECGVEFVIIFSDGRDVQRVSHATTPPTQRVYLEYCGKLEGRFTHYNLFVHGPNDSPDGVFDTADPDAELAAVLDVELKIHDKNVNTENQDNGEDLNKQKEKEEEEEEEEQRRFKQEEEYKKRLQEEKKKHYKEILERQKQDEIKRRQEILRRQEEEEEYMKSRQKQEEEDEEDDNEEEKIQNSHFFQNPFDRLLEKRTQYRPPFDPFLDPFEGFNFSPFGQRLQTSKPNIRNPFLF